MRAPFHPWLIYTRIIRLGWNWGIILRADVAILSRPVFMAEVDASVI